MRVVVTGGAGFLGSHLCERLLRDGHSVVAIDNFITGTPDNVAGFEELGDFRLIQHDVSTFIEVEGEVDGIFHLASPASPIDYLELPIQTLKVGSLGTHNSLGLAKAKGARFFMASTSEVYGDPQVHPQTEAYWGHVNPIGPRGVYDEAKRFSEAITMAYHRHHGVDTRIVRIFNTFGPRMKPGDGRVVSNFIVQALKGDPITIYGDGNQTRSFCYVDDLISGLVKLMEYEGEGADEPVNIGSVDELSMNDIVGCIGEIVGKKLEITRHPLPQNDPVRRRPDTTRAKQRLAWAPQVSLTDGLRKTVDYFRSIGAGQAN